jgi:hypothetical protein
LGRGELRVLAFPIEQPDPARFQTWNSVTVSSAAESTRRIVLAG